MLKAIYILVWYADSHSYLGYRPLWIYMRGRMIKWPLKSVAKRYSSSLFSDRISGLRSVISKAPESYEIRILVLENKFSKKRRKPLFFYNIFERREASNLKCWHYKPRCWTLGSFSKALPFNIHTFILQQKTHNILGLATARNNNLERV